jgi:hypothetical protein
MPGLASIHINPISPQALVMTCSAGGACPDMTAVVSSVIQLLKPDGTTRPLSVTISNKTPASLVLTHLFQTGDLDQVGVYKAYVVHTLPVGQVRGDTQTITVLDNFK